MFSNQNTTHVSPIPFLCLGVLFQDIGYEFIAQSFIIYEDMSDSKEQLRVITLIIGTLLNCTHFNDDNYHNLVTRTTLFR